MPARIDPFQATLVPFSVAARLVMRITAIYNFISNAKHYRPLIQSHHLLRVHYQMKLHKELTGQGLEVVLSNNNEYKRPEG